MRRRCPATHCNYAIMAAATCPPRRVLARPSFGAAGAISTPPPLRNSSTTRKEETCENSEKKLTLRRCTVRKLQNQRKLSLCLQTQHTHTDLQIPVRYIGSVPPGYSLDLAGLKGASSGRPATRLWPEGTHGRGGWGGGVAQGGGAGGERPCPRATLLSSGK